MDVVHLCALEPHRGDLLIPETLAPETRQWIAAAVGQPPQDDTLWLAALTHGSMGEKRDYQRLEFLGDRVLGLTIAGWLYERNQGSEGTLSQRLNALVSRRSCAKMARSCDLPAHIRLGKQARDDGGLDSDNILGDVMESVLGACFIEHGWQVAEAMVRRLWQPLMAGKAGTSKHPKAALQEWAAGNKRKPPEYVLVSREGPDHASRFTVSVAVAGVGDAQATGSSKQDAEKRAASAFMQQFG